VSGPTFCPYVRPDGTVDYHDPSTGLWIEKAASVPDHAMAVLPDDVQRHTLRRMERFA
jgi:hypothetical protein